MKLNVTRLIYVFGCTLNMPFSFHFWDQENERLFSYNNSFIFVCTTYNPSQHSFWFVWVDNPKLISKEWFFQFWDSNIRLIDTYNLKWNIDIKFTEIYRNSISQHEENFAHFKEMLLASPLPFALAMEMKNCKCPS